MTEHSNEALQESAHRHLWMHFTRMSESNNIPTIVRGEGVWVYDQYGKRYLDGLSGLFTVRSATAAPSWPRPRRARPAPWPTSRCGATPTPWPSSWPTGWPS